MASAIIAIYGRQIERTATRSPAPVLLAWSRYRRCRASSGFAIRAVSLLPALVIPPWRRVPPLECSDGTRPRYDISWRGLAKRVMSPSSASTSPPPPRPSRVTPAARTRPSSAILESLHTVRRVAPYLRRTCGLEAMRAGGDFTRPELWNQCGYANRGRPRMNANGVEKRPSPEGVGSSPRLLVQ